MIRLFHVATLLTYLAVPTALPTLFLRTFAPAFTLSQLLWIDVRLSLLGHWLPVLHLPRYMFLATHGNTSSLAQVRTNFGPSAAPISWE